MTYGYSRMGEVLLQGEHTDAVFADAAHYGYGYVGLFGACDELLWLFGPEDADFFEAAAAMLRKRGQDLKEITDNG